MTTIHFTTFVSLSFRASPRTYCTCLLTVRAGPTEHKPEAPRRAGRYSIPLSLASSSSASDPYPLALPPPAYGRDRKVPPPLILVGDRKGHWASPAASEKPLPITPVSGGQIPGSGAGTDTIDSVNHLLSVNAFATTPMGDVFPSSYERETGFAGDALSPPAPAPARLRLVRMLSLKRPAPLDLERGVTVKVEHAVDSGVRLEAVPGAKEGESVLLPPPYTPR